MSTKAKKTKSVKSVKSVKSNTAAKAVKKSTKSTKSVKKATKSTKKSKCESACECRTEYGQPYKNSEGYYEYPDLLDNDGYDSILEDEVPPRLEYFYAVNHGTGKKFVITGYELSFGMAKIIAEEVTRDEDSTNELNDVYVVKVGGAIAWLITNIFKVRTIDSNDILNEVNQIV